MAAFVEHSVEHFAGMDVGELRRARFMATLCVKTAERALAEGDPRAERALEHYRGERRRINQALQGKLYGLDGPPAQAVGLRPVRMGAKAKR